MNQNSEQQLGKCPCYQLVDYLTQQILLKMRRFARLFSTLKFTKSHEWVKFDPTNKTLKIGISNYAQGQLGEIIHLEFEKVGKKVKEGASVATVESVKVVADIYSPVEGTVKAVNTQAEESPEIINDKPLESWIVEISCTTEPQNLLSEEEYNQLLKGEHKE